MSYYQIHKKEVLAKRKKDREENREKYREYWRENKRKNYEKNKERVKAYYTKHKKEILESRKEYKRKYRIKNRIKLQLEKKAYYEKNKDRFAPKKNAISRRRSELERLELKDQYIKTLLSVNTNLSRDDIPQQLIEFKRAQMKVRRLCRELKTSAIGMIIAKKPIQ